MKFCNNLYQKKSINMLKILQRLSRKYLWMFSISSTFCSFSSKFCIFINLYSCSSFCSWIKIAFVGVCTLTSLKLFGPLTLKRARIDRALEFCKFMPRLWEVICNTTYDCRNSFQNLKELTSRSRLTKVSFSWRRARLANAYIESSKFVASVASFVKNPALSFSWVS